MLSSLLGIINFGSTFRECPIPEQLLQAPFGLLKLKFLGSISSILILQSGHEKVSEYCISLLFDNAIFIRPSDNFRDVSIEFVSLSLSISLFICSLSTIISIVCHLFFSSSIFSDNSFISPFIRALIKPDFRAILRVSLCSPFLCLMIGDRIINFEFIGRDLIESTICCIDCFFTSLLHLIQCGVPILANNILK